MSAPIRTTDGTAPEDPLALNWKFNTYIEIEYGYDLNYPYKEYIPHEMMTFGTGQGIMTSADFSTSWGYKLRMSGKTADPAIQVCAPQPTGSSG